MLFNVPGFKSCEGLPATVTRPALNARLYFSMAASGHDQTPPIRLYEFDDLANFHAAARPASCSNAFSGA
jgi:hypothetical protein